MSDHLSTPLTPRARENMQLALEQLSLAITAHDDDTTTNKIRYAHEFIGAVAAQLRIDLSPAPIPQPVFQPDSSLESIIERRKTPTRSSTRITRDPSPELGVSSADAKLKDVIDRYNPDHIELSNSPSSEIFRIKRKDPIKQLAFSNAITADMVKKIRKQFTKEMEEASFNWTKSNVNHVIKFQPEEITTITNMIFELAFGRAGLKRAAAIVQSYRESEADELPFSATIAAAQLAQEEDMPTEFRKFYQGFSDCAKQRNAMNAVQQMLALYEKFLLYDKYNALVHTKKKSLLAFLREHNYKTKQGRNWSSVIHSYLSESLGITSTRLSNILAEYQSIYLMVGTFGVGVLVLIPGTISNSLNRLGIQKCSQAFAIADRLVSPSIKDLCETAEKTILSPILAGNVITKLRLEVAPPATSFLDALGTTTADETIDDDLVDEDMEDEDEDEHEHEDEEMELAAEGDGGDEMVEDESDEVEDEDDTAFEGINTSSSTSK